MTFLSVLTLIFIVLKLMGTITWSWWFVLSPMIFQFLLLLFFGLLSVLSTYFRDQ